MRKLLCSLPLLYFLILYMSGNANAQAPQKFTFQGLALDDMLQPVQNTTIQVRISIIQNNVLGPIVLEELHTVTTNSNGIFTAIVGTAGGDLDQIDWKSDSYYIKAEVDITSSGKFTFIGITQILSVPYALYSNETGRWKHDDPVVQKGIMDSGQTLPQVDQGPRLIWYPRKAAFRAGYTYGAWEDTEIGKFSLASGFNSKASGAFSVSLGQNTLASGENSFSIGYLSKSLGSSSASMGFSSEAHGEHSFASGHSSHAYNPHSIAIGYKAAAMGDHSIAFGHQTVAKANYGIAIGLFNNSFDQPTGGLTDRLFQIGNGSDVNNRTNAMTVLRNGNVGIGGKAISPEFALDVTSRIRIRHEGKTAGLYLNNSQNNPEGFVGMKTDTEIGFYLNGGWKFWINEQGQAWTPLGQLGFASSDLRLKKDLLPLKNSLLALSSLQGYHYNWIDPKRDQTLQTGVIAQEVEKYFPELVQTGENGFKSVNYTGLIPHLIESVKELKSQTAEIVTLRQELAELRDFTKKLKP